jgi:hypothetical protein
MENGYGAWWNDTDGRKLKYLEKNLFTATLLPLAIHDNRPATTIRTVVRPVACSRKTLPHLHTTSFFSSTAAKCHLI